MIYFDNAATTLMKPPEVALSVARAINSFGGVGRGVHEVSLAAGMAVYETRERLAELFGVSNAKQVAFTSNATESLNIAIAGLLRSGDHVITTAASHNSVLRPLYKKQDEEGVELSILPLSSEGAIDYKAFESLIQKNTRMAVVTHASNLTGDVYDIALMARICRERGVLFMVDAAQTAGHIPLQMHDQGIDILAFTGHKSLFGPQGTGGLCVSEQVDIPPFKVGGSGTHSYDRKHPEFMPERLEAGTMNSHGIAGLLAGIEFIENLGINVIEQRVASLRERFLKGISTLEYVRVLGKERGPNCGIVALNVGALDSALVSDILNTEHGICTRSGAHCAPLMHEALGTKEQGAIRFSFSYFNTEAEVDCGIEALRAICESLGSSKQ